MLLTPDTPSTATPLTRSDTVFVLVLTMTLILATSAFFASFTLAAITSGVMLSIVLHRWAGDPDAGDASATTIHLVPINIARVHVGGDVGGLIFVVGSLAIVMLGLPSVRWFLVASLVAAATLAAIRIAWNRRI